MAEPFLRYLTVFKSRFGALNIVLELTSFAHQPELSLLRKLKIQLEKTADLATADPKNAFVFEYLREKRLVSDTAPTGNRQKRRRYSGFGLEKEGDTWVAYDASRKPTTLVPVYQIDIWMAAPGVPSTVGVPTPENVNELLELTLQWHLLVRSKNTWTSAAQLVKAFRDASSSFLADSANPFLLGSELLPLLRQAITVDGFVLRELLRILPSEGVVNRDDVIYSFEEVARKAIEEARRFGYHIDLETLKFQKLIRDTTKKREKQSRAPGVLEHRVSPRLEWLVDFGCLSKDGLSRNGFDYNVLPSAKTLLSDLDAFVGNEHWSESVVASQMRTNPRLKQLKLNVSGTSEEGALRAYKMLKKRIGPSSLIDVAFAASLLTNEAGTFEEILDRIVTYARETKGVELSGGRYQRSPQNIFIPDEILNRI